MEKLVTLLALIATLFLTSCESKPANDLSNAGNGPIESPEGNRFIDLSTLIDSAENITVIEAYLSSLNLTVSPGAKTYSDQFKGFVLEGLVVSIQRTGTNTYALTFDPLSLSALSVGAPPLKENVELKSQLSGLTSFVLIFSSSNSNGLAPSLAFDADGNPVPYEINQRVSFVTDALLKVQSASQSRAVRAARGVVDQGSGTSAVASARSGVGGAGSCQLGGGACDIPNRTVGKGVCCLEPGPYGGVQCKESCLCGGADPVYFSNYRAESICCPLGAHEVRQGTYTRSTCACDDGSVVRNVNGINQCVKCPANSKIENGQCVCNPGLVLDTRVNSCRCPDDRDVLVGGVCQRSQLPLDCKKNGGGIDGQSPTFTQTCHFELPQGCDPLDILNPTSCSFQVAWCCPEDLECGQGRVGSNSPVKAGECGCFPPRIQKSGKCACPVEGQVFDASTKSCNCPEGSILKNGKCEPCGSKAVPNASGNQCVCKPEFPFVVNGECTGCPADEQVVFRDGAYRCECNPGFDRDSNNKCISCASPRVFEPSIKACRCPDSAPFGANCSDCGPNTDTLGTYPNYSCQCKPGNVSIGAGLGCQPCGAHTTQVGAFCVCDPGMVPDSITTCKCPVGTIFDGTKCVNACPPGRPACSIE